MGDYLEKTDSVGSWRGAGLSLLPYLLLLLLAAAEYFRWDILGELVWLLLWPAVCLSGVALIGLAVWLLTWAIEMIDGDLPLWAGSWVGFVFLLGSLPILFVFHFFGLSWGDGLHTLFLLVVLLLLFAHNRRLALLAVLPTAAFFLFLAVDIINGSWVLFFIFWAGLVLITVAVMRWFDQVDGIMWLLFGLGLATSLYLLSSSGYIMERGYSYFQYLALVTTALLLWWLWRRVQERPSYTGWIGYGLLYDLLSVLLIISAPLIYNMEPLYVWGEQQPVMLLLDMPFTPGIALGLEGVWLLLALVVATPLFPLRRVQYNPTESLP